MREREFKVGDLVRISEKGCYCDPAWSGALAVVTQDGSFYDGERLNVWVRRLSDGRKGVIAMLRVELPEEQADEGG